MSKSSKTLLETNWLICSFLLAIVPVVGYMLAFLYESEFCKVFGIPSDFISIDWTTLIIAIGSFFGYFLITFFLFQLSFLLLITGRVNPSIIVRLAIQHVAVLLILSVWYVRYSSFTPNLFYVYLVPILFMFNDFVWPVISQRKVPGYRNKLEAKEAKKGSSPQVDTPSFLQKYRISIILGVVALMFLSYTAFFEGQKSAVEKEYFLVPSTSPQSVVLKVYGDILICAPLAKEDNAIESSYFFIKLGVNTDLVLTSQKIGPLRVIQ